MSGKRMDYERIMDCICFYTEENGNGWMSFYKHLGELFAESYRKERKERVEERETSGLCASCGEKVKGKVVCVVDPRGNILAKFCPECLVEYLEVADEIVFDFWKEGVTMNAVEVPVSKILVNEEILPREGLNKEVLSRYAETIHEHIDDIPFPPITVTPAKDRYLLIDGLHRLEAHRITGMENIKAVIVECKDEAQMVEKALVANLKHGLRLSKEEEIKVARKLYKMGYSTARLAKILGRSRGTIEYWIEDQIKEKKQEKEKKIQEAVEMVKKGTSIRKASEKAGVSRDTIAARLKKEKEPSNGQGKAPEENLKEEKWPNMLKTEQSRPPLTSTSQTGTPNGKEVERLEKEILRMLDEAERLTLELLEIAPGSYNRIEEKVSRLMGILR
ncbi:chromosome partitioning protein [Hydrogenivirga sp. 128-5-R1-1]|nr:chromosome partitioning protein [Hydrogenivirga sp. 128-5-R1-1]